MENQKRRDTTPELAIRHRLHAMGLRYRVDRAPLPSMRNRADIVFGPAKVAVFVDGCFWHRCPEHQTLPKANRAWWADKLAANVERDSRVDSLLRAAGWVVIRVWEHEAAADAAERIAAAVVDRVP